MALSNDDEANIEIDNIIGDEELLMDIELETFEENCAPLFS